jgi:hypothetical protein
MNPLNDVAGTAALSICESLLLALNDANVLPENEIMGILRDAAAAHEHGPKTGERAELNAAVAALINKIINSGNSVRRP